MNTVQWWLNYVDESELTNTFFSIYPVDYQHTADHSRSIRQAQSYEKLRFLTFLYRLRSIEVRPSQEEHVFFAAPCFEGGGDALMTYLCRIEDLYSSETPETLTWLLVDFEKLMGYWIADTELTRANVLFVLSKILYVASFLGYSGKYRELYREVDIEGMQAGPDPLEAEAPAEDTTELALKQAIWQAEAAYNEYCFQRETGVLRAMLSSK